ncbi:hypothetical protein M0805_007408 [Coniferiporia weirii]|nr:hypothetical protein M0805_007408 [Coniferiporia weirii]
MVPKILFVFTSADKTLTGSNTGWYLPEAAHPYYTLSHNCDIDFAAPAGPNPPVDPDSVKMFTDDQSTAFLRDSVVKSKLESTKYLKDIDASEYDAVFYVGGHGPVLDLATDPINIELATQFYRQDKVIAAVCHGTAALAGVMDAQGKSIFEGKEVTGFSNAEEEQIGKTADVPFLLETRIGELGGKYVKAAEPWGVKVVASGNLITGQNPASAGPLADIILKKFPLAA